MVKDFKLMEFATIVENLEKVVSVCNKEEIFGGEAPDVLREISDIITEEIYEKLKVAIGSDFIYKILNLKESSYKQEEEKVL